MLSIIIPANNEAGYIGACLQALLASESPAGPVEVIVAANACTDDTVAIARSAAADAEARGWGFQVLDLEQGGKMNALNAADARAKGAARAYLDADVIVSPPLIAQISAALDRPGPTYASGTPQVAPAQSWATRAYRRIYTRIPFMTTGVPGFGIFAVNGPGRARWGSFPEIISDDTFVRLSFAPEERVGVPATYSWPMVEGLANLVRVRRRQDRGVEEIARLYPDLLGNDDKPPFGAGRAVRMALGDPVGFGVYAFVALATRLGGPNAQSTWTRGR